MPFDFRFINTEKLRDDPRFGGWYAAAGRQPSWAWKIAGTVALLVFIVPILLLTLAAVFAFAIVFGLLMLVSKVLSVFTGGGNSAAPQRNDGRVNVRVIRSE